MKPGVPDSKANSQVEAGTTIKVDETVMVIELADASWLLRWEVSWAWFAFCVITAIGIIVLTYYILIWVREFIMTYSYDACCLTVEEILLFFEEEKERQELNGIEV